MSQLSAIMCAPEGLDSVRKTIAHLQQQEGLQIELVLLQPEGEPEPAEDFSPLLLRRVEVAKGLTPAECWAIGVRAAGSPVVVLTEDHCFPQPGWGKALLEAHRDEAWYAVGPAAQNANVPSSISRADMLMNFLDQLVNPEGPATALMGHNTSYKRAVLLSLSKKQLIRGLRCERVLHQGWGPQHCLHLPKAVVHHVNLSRPIPFLLQKLIGGLVFGAERCAGWTALKRIVYIAGSGAIPALRLYRIVSGVRILAPDEKGTMLSSLRWLIPALILHALGEALGYLCGPAISAPAYRLYSQFEQKRWKMVSERDRLIQFEMPSGKVPATPGK